jgi:hypothetical protein
MRRIVEKSHFLAEKSSALVVGFVNGSSAAHFVHPALLGNSHGLGLHTASRSSPAVAADADA